MICQPLCAAAICLLGLAPLWAQEAIVLANPGFEADGNSDGLPDGWGKAVYGEGFELARDPEQAHSGQASARLSLQGTGDRACFLQVSAPFPAPAGVRLTFWHKGTGRAEGILRFRPAPGVEVEGGEYGTTGFRCETPREQWTQYTVDEGVPALAREHGKVRIEVILYQKAEGALWYDDVAAEAFQGWKPKPAAGDDVLQMPVRPADGRTVMQNPPDFSWRPQPAARSCTFQLSRDEAFAPEQTFELRDWKYNVYSHSRVLEEGRWHWRVRFEDAGGAASEWCEPLSFAVPADAAQFPVPPPEEMLSRIPPDHPRVYATRHSLQQFRARKDGPAREWWRSFSTGIDGYVDAEVDQEPSPEWIYAAGPGPLTDEAIRLGGLLQSHCNRATTRMFNLAFGYLVTGEQRYAHAAVARMLEIATWDPQGVTSYRNHDQVYRDITWRMAAAYDWCWDAMTPEQRRTVADAVIARATTLYEQFSNSARPIYAYPYDSHGITAYGFLGICAIALCHDAPAADDWFRFVAATYPAVFPPWGGEEGGWAQGVGYWKWSQPFAWWFFDALKSATDVDMHQKAFCRNTGWYKLYMHPPWCDRHHFGDGNHGAPDGTDHSNMAQMATRYHNPYYQWYSAQMPGVPQAGIYDYWWFDEALPPRPPADLPQGKYLPDIGWVAMHSDLSDPDDVMLLLKSSPFGSYNHSHGDQNSFVLYACGEPLLIDSGYYDWYGSPHDVGFARQTKAHNCVLVNGEGQPIFDMSARGKITDHFTSPPADYARGDAAAAYKGKLSTFEREIIYLRPDVFVIRDVLEAPEPSTFTWCLHAEQPMELREQTGEVLVRRGEAKCRVKFLTPTDLSFEQDDRFTPPSTRDLASEWHFRATTSQQSTRAEFVVLVFTSAQNAPEAEMVRSADSFPGYVGGLRLGDRSAHVQVAPDGRHIGSESHDCSARLWLAAQRAGNAVDVLLDGTHLGTTGKGGGTQIRASAPVTAVVQWKGVPNINVARRAWVKATQDTEFSLLVARGDDAPESIRLDGVELDAGAYEITRQDGGTQATVHLSPGSHEIIVGPSDEPAAIPVSIGSGDAPVQVQQETMPVYSGGALTFGTFDAEPGPVLVSGVECPEGGRMSVSGVPPQEGQLLWLRPRNSFTARTATAPGAFALRLTPVPLDTEPLEAQPVVGPAPGDAIKVEAETYVASGGGWARRYTHRTFLSGGVGVETEVAPGQWLQWEVDVPVAGRYALAVKGASHEVDALRFIEVDGRPLGGEYRRYRFPGTGGYGATPQEWKEMMVSGEEGQPVVIALEAGKHTLRWTLVERKLNLDYLLLVPLR